MGEIVSVSVALPESGVSLVQELPPVVETDYRMQPPGGLPPGGPADPDDDDEGELEDDDDEGDEDEYDEEALEHG